MADMPLLSICIPTFNREDYVVALVRQTLRAEGDFEICVHIDGSTDNTQSSLEQITDRRLRITSAANRGRATAISAAIAQSKGRFVMLFDDDDTLYEDCLAQILSDCEAPLNAETCGYIYNMAGTVSGVSDQTHNKMKVNFLSLRADYSVVGDKKEVVAGQLIKRASDDFSDVYRRIPTSLIWARIALNKDVCVRDITVGEKHYLPAGLTDGMHRIKKANAAPMVSLYVTHVKAYFLGRYKSPRFLFRAIAGVIFYSVYSALNRVAANGRKTKHV